MVVMVAMLTCRYLVVIIFIHLCTTSTRVESWKLPSSTFSRIMKKTSTATLDYQQQQQQQQSGCFMLLLRDASPLTGITHKKAYDATRIFMHNKLHPFTHSSNQQRNNGGLLSLIRSKLSTIIKRFRQVYQTLMNRLIDDALSTHSGYQAFIRWEKSQPPLKEKVSKHDDVPISHQDISVGDTPDIFLIDQGTTSLSSISDESIADFDAQRIARDREYVAKLLQNIYKERQSRGYSVPMDDPPIILTNHSRRIPISSKTISYGPTSDSVSVLTNTSEILTNNLNQNRTVTSSLHQYYSRGLSLNDSLIRIWNVFQGNWSLIDHRFGQNTTEQFQICFYPDGRCSICCNNRYGLSWHFCHRNETLYPSIQFDVIEDISFFSFQRHVNGSIFQTQHLPYMEGQLHNQNYPAFCNSYIVGFNSIDDETNILEGFITVPATPGMHENNSSNLKSEVENERIILGDFRLIKTNDK